MSTTAGCLIGLLVGVTDGGLGRKAWEGSFERSVGKLEPTQLRYRNL